ncbi:molybdate ABC transporter substrate-binding protein [Leptospira perdikensis]|uniref:Molybdate ABC transporter substrate-binding protein n=1 Tax=Leptospira perdikensis TaxID=2484948 RepID=A0A4V3JPF4_9LEPT|nr:molybdate ABC transporter substrate-binding protein [Leptospira perdikensis]TGL44369.1 molybdate ABC transporter substrate-binding protein [Leptospira perdikensis]
MKNIRITILFSLLFVFGIFAENPVPVKTPKGETEIVVAVAANFKNPMEEIRLSFLKQNPEINVKLIFGASGQLTTQIQNGAPADIFLSADMDFPLALYKDGYSLQGPKVYAVGVLVLLSQKEIEKTKSISELLSSENIKFIAIANPRTAPYGKAAVEALQSLGLYEKLKHKFVFGESITQVNQFISTGSADVGFTSFSALYGNEDNFRFSQQVDPKTYSTIHQGAIVIQSKEPKSEEQKIAISKLFDYLFSTETKSILLKYGYKIPEK